MTVGGAFDTGGFLVDYSAGVPVWQASGGVGANTMALQDDVIGALFSATVERAFTPFALIKPTIANLGAGFIGTEQQRVYRLQIQLKMAVLSIDRASGVQFSPATVLGPSWTQLGQPAFGVVGDGAGAWEYIQSDTGAFPGNITDSLVIPAGTIPDATEWNTFDFELINSAPGRAATFTLFVNGISVISRNWTVAPVMPLLSEIANANKFIWGVRSATAGAGFWIGPLSVEMGRFTRAGLEMLS